MVVSADHWCGQRVCLPHVCLTSAPRTSLHPGLIWTKEIRKCSLRHPFRYLHREIQVKPWINGGFRFYVSLLDRNVFYSCFLANFLADSWLGHKGEWQKSENIMFTTHVTHALSHSRRWRICLQCKQQQEMRRRLLGPKDAGDWLINLCHVSLSGFPAK